MRRVAVRPAQEELHEALRKNNRAAQGEASSARVGELEERLQMYKVRASTATSICPGALLSAIPYSPNRPLKARLQ